MTIVRIEHAVLNFEQWNDAFDRDPGARKGSGVRRDQILRPRDEPNDVMIDLELDSHEEAEAFVHTMEQIWNGPGGAVMQNPRARIADRVEFTVLRPERLWRCT
jgi:hypothetical protein